MFGEVNPPLVLRHGNPAGVAVQSGPAGDVLGDIGSLDVKGQLQKFAVPDSPLQGKGHTVYCLALAKDRTDRGQRFLGLFLTSGSAEELIGELRRLRVSEGGGTQRQRGCGGQQKGYNSFFHGSPSFLILSGGKGRPSPRPSDW